ncbi:phospholipase D-like domain-containing protein [Halomonas sp. M20]|uniref:phospholipase D-like domain-containing protein n=1 Tax=Halomonas sp. M20 TaxID=2763264 RepID=UPI001D0AE242|nr:phospholipase D-like domain-containing protein [Halomonas sp. M20]
MEVIYWQIVVAGSTGVAYLLGSRIICVGVAGAWTLWTFAMLSYGPLVILQMFSAWGSFFAIDAFTKQSRQLTEFKAALDGFRKDDKKALIEAKEKGRFTLLSDSSHYEYMLLEMGRSDSSIMILSGWISDKVIDGRFLRVAAQALERGVDIYVGFGYENSEGHHEMTRPAKRALVSLERLAREHRNLHVGRFNNHQKALVVDKRRVVCGSHNWLSNRAFKNREQSFIIEDNAAAKAVFLHSSPLITDNPAFEI